MVFDHYLFAAVSRFLDVLAADVVAAAAASTRFGDVSAVVFEPWRPHSYTNPTAQLNHHNTAQLKHSSE